MRGHVLTAGFIALTLGGCIPATDYGPPPGAAPAETYDPPPPPQDLIPAPPSAPPAWEARPVTADARTIPDSIYVVQPGDTLRRVADKTGDESDVRSVLQSFRHSLISIEA